MGRGLAVLVLVAICEAVSIPASARDDDKTRCISASEEAQQLRDDGKYTSARDAFTTCARDVCPTIVRRDCVRWLAELEQLWPSVVLSAKDGSGNDLVAVKVLMDGTPILASLDGKPFFLDPGEHEFRFEAQGYPAAEQVIVVHASEKARQVAVVLGTPNPTSDAVPPPTVTPRAPPSPTPSARSDSAAGAPAGAWVFLGLAAAAFGTEAYLGITGLNDRSSLVAQPCAKTATCSASDVASIRTKFTVADIALGVGVVSAIVSAYLFLTNGSPESPQPKGARLDVVPTGGGAAATVGASF